MKQIVIVGTGAVSAEITSYIEDTNYGDIAQVEIKGYLEYPYNIEKYYKFYNLSKPILGDIDNYNPAKDDYFIIAVSNINFRKIVIEKLETQKVTFFNMIHNSAIIARTAKIGKGNIINPNCMVGPNAVIGDFNLMTSGTMISHDCKVGNNNVFSTAILCGHVQVGNENLFGIRGTVIPELTIGSRTVIQAGMIVDKNVPDETTVFHRFKEKVLAIPKQ